jgi:hypothetical protein
MTQIGGYLFIRCEGLLDIDVWTAPELVITSSELSVNDWSFPITPEIGGAAFAWAQTVCGVPNAASKAT